MNYIFKSLWALAIIALVSCGGKEEKKESEDQLTKEKLIPFI